MHRQFVKYFSLCATVLFSFLIYTPAHAAPYVNSFSANPSSISNSYGTNLTWDVAAGSGGTITITSCSPGITLTDENGASLSCDSPRIINNASGSAGYTFYNVSGTAKAVIARLVPKDSDGVLYPDLANNVVLTINNAYQTITEYRITPGYISSGSSASVSWTGVYIPGTNLQFECNANLKVYTSQGGTFLPCGVPAFSSDLPMTGSQSIYVVNSSGNESTLNMTLLPAVAAGAYDGTHAMQLTLAVGPALPPPSLSVSSFSASSTQVTSGGSTLLSWGVAYGQGANLQIMCGTDIKVTAIVGGATTTLPCGTTVFAQVLPATSTQTLFLTNQGYSAQTLQVMLLPQDANGTYLGTLSKTVSITVYPAGAVIPTYVSTPTTQPSTPTQSGGVAHTPLTVGLGKGITGSAQVKILQTFLALDTEIYALGLVTGYFGPATEAAVKRFQERYKIAKVGDPGYGYVGPMTRAKINTLTRP